MTSALRAVGATVTLTVCLAHSLRTTYGQSTQSPPKTWIDKDTGHRVYRVSEDQDAAIVEVKRLRTNAKSISPVRPGLKTRLSSRDAVVSAVEGPEALTETVGRLHMLVLDSVRVSPHLPSVEGDLWAL